jgi:hypothetical protein
MYLDTTVSDSTIEIDVYVFSPEDIDLNSIFTVAWAIEYGQENETEAFIAYWNYGGSQDWSFDSMTTSDSLTSLRNDPFSVQFSAV